KLFVNGASVRYDVSETGTLAYAETGAADGPRVLGLVDLRVTGAPPEVLPVPPAQYSSPRLSPDGRRLAVHSGSEVAGNRVVWVYDLTGDRAIRQLTFEGDSHHPVWTPDGERIAFASDREGTASIYWQPADGSGAAERLTTAEDGVEHLPSSWSPDGRRLVYIALSIDDADVWAVEPGGGSEPVFQDPNQYHLGPELSPNGRWIAYHTGKTLGDQDVYVEPFPPTGARHRISQSGGYWSMWSRTGTQLFYRSIAQSVAALRTVDVVTEPRFEFSPERELPPKGFVTVSFQRDYDITPDGRKMLMVYPADFASRAPRPTARIHVVVNWLEELKQRIPH
ncbi:MAG: hypothetical protein OEW19_15740, partial [Acidobacteriota bacterium]|nr:hypothetical protein [Acidobacteriota bacterium]